ncbi:HmuY family protein [Lewinella sp. W8]|uniref:HmuY family protein n=1 Tax=Lewinella sp. W8 TaxID=2528208 RepID=UPI001067FD18|nr:HmuY family protein [Lewinella sp. W8]MTB53140.1 T9SS type A sorting domain-containing protein [Lewinella sp. W8]
MKHFLPLLLVFVTPFTLTAQFLEVNQGPGYANAVYLDLATNTTTEVALDAWDIAFAVGGRSSGVLVNEGVASSRTEATPEVELYLTSSTDFATADTSMIIGRIYNGEASWEDGAFNSVASPGDPFDLGWGSYSPATQAVLGTRVFYVLTRDGAYHKVMVSSLAGGEYTFVYETLTDGEGVDVSTDTVRINKSDYVGKTLVYFSFAEGLKDLEPENWDLLFSRYTTPLDDGEGNILEYTVTGVLQNEGISVAELSGVDPATAAPPAEGTFSDSLTTIGHDWKLFDLNTFQYVIPDDLVYFVRTADSLYRIQFIDFTGASMGISTLEMNNEGALTNVSELPVAVESSRLFPNPTPGVAMLEVDLKEAANQARLDIFDVNGRLVSTTSLSGLNAGRNRIEVPSLDLPRGNYLIRLTASVGTLTHHLVKQ